MKLIKYAKTISFGIAAITFIVLKLIIIYYAKSNPEQINKFYSMGIYRGISKVLTSISNIFPFSIGEIIIGILFITAIILIVRIIILVIKRRFFDSLDKLVVLIFFITLFLFYCDASWLLNNYRPDFEVLAGLTVGETTKEDLADTFKALIIKTDALRDGLKENEEHTPSDLSVKEVLQTAYLGYEPLAKEYDLFRPDKVIVKGLFSSPFQTVSGYSGVYLFFVGEPAINIEAPIFTLPHTACHELAHQQGFAQEEAANYIGFLACKNNPSTFFQYSGYLSAAAYVGNALYEQDSELYKSVAKLYSQKVLNDLLYEYDFWHTHEKQAASKVVNGLNDSYLKSYNQEDGIKSYGKYVDFLIADYLADKSI